MTRRQPVRRFDPSLIHHRAPGVLGELEQLTSRLIAGVDRMARQLRSIDADRTRSIKQQQLAFTRQHELDLTCR